MQRSLIAMLLVILLMTDAEAATRWVATSGNDSGPGTAREPWRTCSHAFANLTPGDELIIKDGNYNEGQIYVRQVGFDPLHGYTEARTLIQAENPGEVTIRGNLDVRGSYITIQGLRIIGEQARSQTGYIQPGIGIYWSHHIKIIDNVVRNCGGGGIQFNHSDWIEVEGNVCFDNAALNSDQHSGISIYQPVRLGTNTDGDYWGILIRGNRSYKNYNSIPNPVSGKLTDGNGIILDDYRYEQTDLATRQNWRSKGFINGTASNPSPYPRRTLVENNICFDNGGSGIQCYLAVGVRVKNNTCVANRWNTLPLYGQISIQDSYDCVVVNNIAAPTEAGLYAATERDTPGGRTNSWSNNVYWNFAKATELWWGSGVNRFAAIGDPLFVDMKGSDYRLRVDSPARNHGVVWNNYEDIDLFGVPRGDETDGKVDAGALERRPNPLSLRPVRSAR